MSKFCFYVERKPNVKNFLTFFFNVIDKSIFWKGIIQCKWRPPIKCRILWLIRWRRISWPVKWTRWMTTSRWRCRRSLRVLRRLHRPRRTQLLPRLPHPSPRGPNSQPPASDSLATHRPVNNPCPVKSQSQPIPRTQSPFWLRPLLQGQWWARLCYKLVNPQSAQASLFRKVLKIRKFLVLKNEQNVRL